MVLCKAGFVLVSKKYRRAIEPHKIEKQGLIAMCWENTTGAAVGVVSNQIEKYLLFVKQ